jgi:hypothetical protein
MKPNLARLLLAMMMSLFLSLPGLALAQSQQPNPQPPPASGKQIDDEFNQLKKDITLEIDKLDKDMGPSASKLNDCLDKAKAVEKEYIDAVAKASSEATLNAISARYADFVKEAIKLRNGFVSLADKNSVLLDQKLNSLYDSEYAALVEANAGELAMQIGKLQKIFEPVRQADGLSKPVSTKLVITLAAMTADQRAKLTDQQVQELFQEAARKVLENKAQK